MIEDISGKELIDEFKTNKKFKLTSMVIGGVLIIAALFFLYRQFMWMPANEESKDSYWIGLNYAKQDSTDLAIEEFEAAANNFDGKVGGEVAQLMLATELMDKKEFESALSELNGVKLSDTYLAGQVVKLKADCNAELKNYPEAANLYLEASEINPNENTTPDMLFMAGLCAEESKDFAKALECYQKIKDEYPNTSRGMTIEKYIARVEFKTVK